MKKMGARDQKANDRRLSGKRKKYRRSYMIWYHSTERIPGGRSRGRAFRGKEKLADEKSSPKGRGFSEKNLKQEKLFSTESGITIKTY